MRRFKLVLLLVFALSTQDSLSLPTYTRWCSTAIEKVAELDWASPAHRNDPTFGGFAYGMSPKELGLIASMFSENGLPIAPIPGKSVETVLRNAAYRVGFWNKIAVVMRDIAGSHMFNDANHRTTYEVVRRLMDRNAVHRITDQELYNVISKVARHVKGYETVEEIATVLRGY